MPWVIVSSPVIHSWMPANADVVAKVAIIAFALKYATTMPFTAPADMPTSSATTAEAAVGQPCSPMSTIVAGPDSAAMLPDRQVKVAGREHEHQAEGHHQGRDRRAQDR